MRPDLMERGLKRSKAGSGTGGSFFRKRLYRSGGSLLRKRPHRSGGSLLRKRRLRTAGSLLRKRPHRTGGSLLRKRPHRAGGGLRRRKQGKARGVQGAPPQPCRRLRPHAAGHPASSEAAFGQCGTDPGERGLLPGPADGGEIPQDRSMIWLHLKKLLPIRSLRSFP